MAEPIEESKGQPPFDPNKLFVKFEALIKKNSSEVGDGRPGRTGNSWIWSMVLPLVVLAATAAFAWFSRRGNRELAKLRHEKHKNAWLLQAGNTAKRLAESNELIQTSQEQIDEAEANLRIIHADIRAEEKRYEADRNAIHRIQSWDGSYIRKG